VVDAPKRSWFQELALKVAGPLVVATVLTSVGAGVGSWVALRDLGSNVIQLDARFAELEKEHAHFILGKSRYTKEGELHAERIRELLDDHKQFALRLRQLEALVSAIQAMQSMQGSRRKQ